MLCRVARPERWQQRTDAVTGLVETLERCVRSLTRLTKALSALVVSILVLAALVLLALH